MKFQIHFLALTSFLFIISSSAYAQNENDALRYSRYYYTGTARFAAMGGAFGALGADISNLSNNPAGLGVFRKHQFTVTPGVSINSTQSSYLGEINMDTRATFNLANLGMVLSSRLGRGRRSPNTGWQFINFGLAYTKTADMNQQTLIRGTNSSTSILQPLVTESNTLGSEDYYTSLLQQAQLLIQDTLTGENYAFLSPWPNAGKIQRQSIEGRGSMGDVSFALAANYANTIYIGASLNVTVTNYRQTSYYSEADAGDSIPEFKDFTIKEYFRTRGSGISGKFGLIYRPADFIRLGLSIHTPTVYYFTDNYTTDVTANYDGGFTGQGLSQLGVYKYRFSNPFRLQLSTGFVIGKYGLIGLEYEYVNYKAARFRDVTGSTDVFQDVNDRIKQNFRNGHIAKIGGELRLEPFSLRAGFNYASNPYQSNVNNSNTWGLSAGAGYRSVTTGIFIDLAYSLFVTKESYWMYDPSLAPRVDNMFQKHSVLLTAGVNF